MKPLAILISYHHPSSGRKAGFHFIADGLRKRGWRVLFVTTSFSWINRLKSSDHRPALAPWGTTNRIHHLDVDLDGFVWEPPIHPISLRKTWLDRLARPFFERAARRFPEKLIPAAREAKMVVFESCAGLSLAPRLQQLNPKAVFVYRVSDDLPGMGAPEILCDLERRALPQMSWMSTPCEAIRARLEREGANKARLSVDLHGVDFQSLKDLPGSANPYQTQNNAVFVGISLLDQAWLARAARLAPHWNFHIVGPFEQKVNLPNVFYTGLLPFHETLPYIRFAQYGLHTLISHPALATYTDTLKIQQYSFCNLPTLAPSDLIAPHRPFFLYERDNDESIRGALERAEKAHGTLQTSHLIGSWEQVIDRLVAPVQAQTS